MFHTVEDALKDLKRGKVIIVCDDENRENEGDFIALAEHSTPEVINFMAIHGRGLICTPISEQLAEKLNLHPMVSDNTDVHRTAFTVSIDHKTIKTGISAFDRSDTIQALLQEDVKVSDFRRPGHVFPLISKEGGVLSRVGHTEAAVDLAKLAGGKPVAVICEIMKEDGTMARVPDLITIAKQLNLKLITIKDLVAFRQRQGELYIQE
ncbi:3,4-dihydroxy-2-butanone-4-phosphate synthase [Peribacillus simplex]|uniref:3,4-dihydroxy-2-butanone 4-phosphate synthase n=1 Tax=Peribacillus simplex TaxID=1478 RepID=A0A8B5Y4B0_9BACI|nr:3,4-dihydroxy-2-butanone-4-phosphate synthase [Peribacillus simplex]